MLWSLITSDLALNTGWQSISQHVHSNRWQRHAAGEQRRLLQRFKVSTKRALIDVLKLSTLSGQAHVRQHVRTRAASEPFALLQEADVDPGTLIPDGTGIRQRRRQCLD